MLLTVSPYLTLVTLTLLNVEVYHKNKIRNPTLCYAENKSCVIYVVRVHVVGIEQGVKQGD